MKRRKRHGGRADDRGVTLLREVRGIAQRYDDLVAEHWRAEDIAADLSDQVDVVDTNEVRPALGRLLAHLRDIKAPFAVIGDCLVIDQKTIGTEWLGALLGHPEMLVIPLDQIPGLKTVDRP